MSGTPSSWFGCYKHLIDVQRIGDAVQILRLCRIGVAVDKCHVLRITVLGIDAGHIVIGTHIAAADTEQGAEYRGVAGILLGIHGQIILDVIQRTRQGIGILRFLNANHAYDPEGQAYGAARGSPILAEDDLYIPPRPA